MSNLNPKQLEENRAHYNKLILVDYHHIFNLKIEKQQNCTIFVIFIVVNVIFLTDSIYFY